MGDSLLRAFDEQSALPPHEAQFDVPLQSLPGGLSHEDWFQISMSLRDGGHWQATVQLAYSAAHVAAASNATTLPVHQLFDTAFTACADSSACSDAFLLLRKYEKSSSVICTLPGIHEYGEVLRACSNCGEWRRAVSLLRRARNCGLKPTPSMYANAITSCDSAGRADESVELYALAYSDKVFNHWHPSEAFSLDLHGFNAAVAACAVRYALLQEVGNFLPSDLKIITGAGRHSENGSSVLGPRIKQLLSSELTPPLPFETQERLDCDETGCRIIKNDGCLVVPVQHLFKWLVDSRPFESYVVNIDRP